MKIKIDNATADLTYKPDWKDLTPAQKARYIWDYYKLPIAIALGVLLILFYILFRVVTRTNEILYVGTLNLPVSDELTAYLSDEYVDDPAYGPRDRVSFFDMGSYSEDEDSPAYAASTMTRIKLMAYEAADQLDVVLMDQEAFDAFRAEGYLADLARLPEAASLIAASPDAGSAPCPGIDLTSTDFPFAASFETSVYIGIMDTSARTGEALSYIRYAMGER